MTDIVDTATRSRIMARIRGRNTAPEVALRSALHRRGLRFRLHRAGLPGRPDIVLPRHRAVVFVHGCFWHRHQGCRLAYSPRSRVEFWQSKFARTVERDAQQRDALLGGGWRVATVWECGLREHGADDIAGELVSWLVGGSANLEIGASAPERVQLPSAGHQDD